MKHLAQAAGDRSDAKRPVSAVCICVLVSWTLAPSGGATVNALIVGRLTNCGPGTRCFPLYHAVLRAFNAQHRLVAREQVTNGHFSFALAPGRYTLIANARNRPQTKRSVTARARRTVHAHIVIHTVVPCCKPPPP
jgi:hypothetical protein